MGISRCESSRFDGLNDEVVALTLVSYVVYGQKPGDEPGTG